MKNILKFILNQKPRELHILYLIDKDTANGYNDYR